MSKKKSNHGGARSGAGRPKGSGKYKEPTKAIRVPEGSVTYIKDFLKSYPDVSFLAAAYSHGPRDSFDNESNPRTNVGNATEAISASNVAKLQIPLISSLVAAGYPTAADEHVDDSIDLNDYMIRKPDSTYMVRVEGESMKNAGILPGDILVVDRALKAEHNKIVIAALDGELTVKRLYRRAGITKLMPENPSYPEIEVNSEAELVVWGVVIGSFRRFQTF